jgi:hypothetical protein
MSSRKLTLAGRDSIHEVWVAEAELGSASEVLCGSFRWRATMRCCAQAFSCNPAEYSLTIGRNSLETLFLGKPYVSIT